MLGAIAGDIIGSVYEARPIKSKSFPLFVPLSTFTDDTELTVAVAHHLLFKPPLVETLNRLDQPLRQVTLQFRTRFNCL